MLFHRQPLRGAVPSPALLAASTFLLLGKDLGFYSSSRRNAIELLWDYTPLCCRWVAWVNRLTDGEGMVCVSPSMRFSPKGQFSPFVGPWGGLPRLVPYCDPLPHPMSTAPRPAQTSLCAALAGIGGIRAHLRLADTIQHAPVTQVRDLVGHNRTMPVTRGVHRFERFRNVVDMNGLSPGNPPWRCNP
jgi:hypothetical protein